MIPKPCPREPELAAAIQQGHWPHACPADLRAHASVCRDCRSTLLLATAFHHDHTAAQAQASLLPPGILWWRAQLRRRNAALERTARPLALAQGITVALSLAAAVLLALWFGPATGWFPTSSASTSASTSSGPATSLLASLGRALDFHQLLPTPMQTPLGIAAAAIACFAAIAALTAALTYATSDRT